jgi:ABC-2 type transport system permease protein
MHNLRTVFKFEVQRTLKKTSFWIMALAFPLAMAAIFGIIYLSNKTTEDAANKMKDATFSMQILDESHLLSAELLAQVKATTPSSKEAGITAVKAGTVDAFIFYPANLAADKIEVFAQDVGLFDNGKYDSVAQALLAQSVSATVNASTVPAFTAVIPASFARHQVQKKPV